jgi:hypothetical protein
MLLFALLAAPIASASAFCGFYVSGSRGELYSDATMVVLMREGRHTVLSMRNDYQGPPEDFALVIPVPTVLSEGDVQTLPRDVFETVEELSAPRLVEYWESAPYCARPGELFGFGRGYGGSGEGAGATVRVEARFAVGEYDIVILGAGDSAALESWLRSEGYRIPEGAAETLRPYVEAGTKFFVAKVDVSRLSFSNGSARLSPLRIHYEDDDLELPIRLGLANSPGTQDLIVHVLATERYEVANHANVFIPTNVVVRRSVKNAFPAFYAALFDRTLEANPGAVVTEYAWNAASCDPCPGPSLSAADVATLGGDMMPELPRPGALTLTRLHYRYDASSIGDDLVFRAAAPVAGGRGEPDEDGRLESGVQASTANAFQARYAILHRHRPVANCQNRIHTGWGGTPPPGASTVVPALDTAKVRSRRASDLELMIRSPIPELRIAPRSRPAPARPPSASSLLFNTCASGRRC